MPRTALPRPLALALIALAVLVTPHAAIATDIDGPGDCNHFGFDLGDAPEDTDAYPGVLGRFPTCASAAPHPGLQELLGCGPFSTAPGAAAGWVFHVLYQDAGGVWLGCEPTVDIGIDVEAEAKTSTGSLFSACSGAPVDCSESAFGLTFGQDECFGDNDAGLVGPTNFNTCSTSQVEFRYFNCGGSRPMYLNVLIDFNHDGDWNDAEFCNLAGTCAAEWAVINQPFLALPGCNQRLSAPFVVGTTSGPAWMRITISEQPAPGDFPWAGSQSLSGGQFQAGETEDYPVHIETGSDCPSYFDYGDAPEDRTAYSNGVVGRFPTCEFPSPAGTLDLQGACFPNSTFPGVTGFVRHEASPANPDQFWIGCPAPGGVPPQAVDSEDDGKVNLLGAGTPSDCDPAVITDCAETLGALTFGQDECAGDADAGVAAPFVFDACELGAIAFKAFSCTQQDQVVYVNVLLDWNQDGDWNDNLLCPSGLCAAEWAIKNAQMTLTPGCNNVGLTPIRVGPNGGEGWMRITLTRQPVPDDFPWNGSAGLAGQAFDGGETEDYPFTITPPIVDPGPYNDRGDAPEGFLRYPGGLGSDGNFPTCTVAAPPSTQTLVAGCAALSSPPGPAGYVNHLHLGPPAPAAWLGCGMPGIDSEPDGKTNLVNFFGPFSSCDQTTLIDCTDNTIGIDYGADECPGDGDAGIAAPFIFQRCEPTQFDYTVSNAAANGTQMYLNVLVDWNDDGDWNDVDYCPFQGGCAPEWAVKNEPITLARGCNSLKTPQFLSGRNTGISAWMRVTITFSPVNDDFPWAGSANLPGGSFDGGETEDYVFFVDGGTTPCLDQVDDMGDAPEGLTAYPSGVLGAYPTCPVGAVASTQSAPAGCPAPSTAPSGSGYVVHVNRQVYPPFWLGCAMSPPPTFAIDNEIDPKVNLTGAFLPGQCPSGGGSTTDCHEIFAFMAPLTFGQDECYGDLDAGLPAMHQFPGCGRNSFDFEAESCWDQPQDVYLNVLVDWNRDGDWNDVERCSPNDPCAPEWAVKNHKFTLSPGCGTYTTPLIQSAGSDGPAWMRVTLTPTPVNDDFPWAGSSTEFPNRFYEAGETEDYVVMIVGSPVAADPAPRGDLWLGPALPNPARDWTTVRFALPQAGTARVVVFDAAGRLVRTLVEGEQPAGEQAASWDYRDADGVRVPAGVYLMQLEFAGRSLTQRVVRLK